MCSLCCIFFSDSERGHVVWLTWGSVFILQELFGAGILFMGFGVICVLSLLFIYFIVPETKGLTLEEIEAKCL